MGDPAEMGAQQGSLGVWVQVQCAGSLYSMQVVDSSHVRPSAACSAFFVKPHLAWL